ncbi:hypothetical protein [Testudinibacter sp. TR-2022]|uniref:hypothetical protein n=1 Tax=Testudinibacter sp. TR-2022 TaxID=2585029 RepID=UPI001118D3D7|nr:hypothetical protein [Testudinibacter sp. TR-2022]TNH22369.1 hypothetical protein FHQ29_07565 [Testudinibacter sp. TR-2022]
MNLKEHSNKELEEKFENFIINIDDYLENFIEKVHQKGYDLDFSIDSLQTLEKYLIGEKIDKNSDDVNDAAAYFGEVVRMNYGGQWICNLDKENNSLYYGLPVITGLGKVKDVLLSPFTSVKSLLLRPRENHFKTIIDNHISPKLLDLDDIPTEK